MSDQQFAVGDIVQLKSGGPSMTVEWVGEHTMTGQVVAQCKWFDEKRKVCTESFPPATLKKAPAE